MIQKTATICSFTSTLNQCAYQCVGALATCSCVGTHTHTHAHNTSTVCLCSARADSNCCSYHRQLFCVYAYFLTVASSLAPPPSGAAEEYLKP